MAPPSTPRLWHSLVLLHAHGCALCFGKPYWQCSGQCLPPTHTWALSPCGSSKLSHSKCQGRMGLSLLLWLCPGAPQHPAIALKLLGTPGFPQLAIPAIPSAW